jgi:tRNA-2-methylthio-N6-dimethylallyladenosine synthase
MKNKTYHIITIGCQMNKSDSERIAGYLEKQGYIWSQNKNEADLVVVTTCGVRQSAEDRVYGIVPRIKRENPQTKIVLTGCLSNREDVKKRLKDKVDIWLPITQLGNLANKLKTKIQIKDNRSGSSISGYLKINPKYSSRFSAFVPIGNGCNNFCTYCVVPYARGREVYRPAEDIMKEVKELVKSGYKEIILIAQNVNSYKSQIATNLNTNSHKLNFSDLLRLVNSIEGNFWIRFATSHPKDMSDDLIRVIAEASKVCEHIHLPVQAGDNEILRAMNRNYTVEH